MESLRNQRTQYPDDGSGYPPPQERLLGTQPVAGYYQHGPVQQASAIPYASSIPDPSLSQEPSHDVRLTNEYSQTHPDDPDVQQDDALAKAAQKKRLIWSASHASPGSSHHDLLTQPVGLYLWL
jgi:hypothetical protein